ncbi:RNA polymerase sigma factor [Lysinibacillus odysseyi]|uniref:RNA polymerase sigma factor n=1 Tax=Lysinibacillus odysseyi TaxID=202611 RepID=UPI000A7D29D4|nr:sigma-70 family RNA polymerase sigma factor [Lysinibacillus odysseyi]
MNEQQLEHIMNEFTQYLIRIGYYYTKDIDRSKDFVQDVFIKLYYSDYIEQGNIKAYLSTMMKNRCMDYLRSWNYRKLVLQRSFGQEPLIHRKDELIEQEEKEILDEAILNLKIKLREVIVYYYLEELTTREIAAILQIPESTVKTRLQAARKKLKEQLHQHVWEVLMHE